MGVLYFPRHLYHPGHVLTPPEARGSYQNRELEVLEEDVDARFQQHVGDAFLAYVRGAFSVDVRILILKKPHQREGHHV